MVDHQKAFNNMCDDRTYAQVLSINAKIKTNVKNLTNTNDTRGTHIINTQHKNANAKSVTSFKICITTTAVSAHILQYKPKGLRKLNIWFLNILHICRINLVLKRCNIQTQTRACILVIQIAKVILKVTNENVVSKSTDNKMTTQKDLCITTTAVFPTNSQQTTKTAGQQV